MTSTLATVAPTGAGQLATPFKPFRFLDTRSVSPIVEATPRVDAIATISAGFKDENATAPTRSTDGRIFLHDPSNRAPGLRDALAENDYKSLTVAFPSNDLEGIIQQRFVLYSRTQLLLYGDADSITAICSDDSRVTYPVGTPEYDDARRRCKVSNSIYFQLARWDEQGGPRVYFPDGLGLYRLRFTSHNSIRAIVSSLEHIQSLTGGRIAGLPFKLCIEQRKVTDEKAMQRRVPVWTCVFAPPTSLEFSSHTFRSIATAALEQGSQLMLPAPTETIEGEVQETQVVDLDEITEADAQALAQGGLCDSDYYRRLWFATVDGTPFDDDDVRAQVILEHCEAAGVSEPTDSLSAFLSRASDPQAGALITTLNTKIEEELNRRIAGYYELMAEGEQLEIGRQEIPEGATFRTVKKYCTDLAAAIKRKQATAAQLQDPVTGYEQEPPQDFSVSDEPVPYEPEPTQPVYEPESSIPGVIRYNAAPPQQGRTLNDAVKEVRQNAASGTDEGPFADNPPVAAANDTSAETTASIMGKLFERGVQHGGDTQHSQVLSITNNWLGTLNPPRPSIESLYDLKGPDARVFLVALYKGEVPIGLA